MLYNALSEACKNASISTSFFDNLRTLSNFLSDQQLRRKFVVSCVGEHADAAQLKSFPRVHIDWRWEFLCAAIDSVMRVHSILRTKFDVRKVEETQGGVNSRPLIKEVRAALDDDTFPCVAEVFRTLGAVVERCAKRLEGCHCHGDIWRAPNKFRARRDAVAAKTGGSSCVWKGRHGPWFVAEGLESLWLEIASATSTRL
jgi:hypothetical protein